MLIFLSLKQGRGYVSIFDVSCLVYFSYKQGVILDVMACV